MKNRDGSENNDDWATPKKLYDELNNELILTLIHVLSMQNLTD